MRIGRPAGGLLKAVGALTLLGLMLGAGVLFLAGSWMSRGDEPAPADYIVCLSGDAERLLYTADLYAQGLAPAILLSRSKPSRPTNQRLRTLLTEIGFPDYDRETYRLLLLQAAEVPPEAVHFYGQDVLSTVEEAEALRAYLAQRPDGGAVRLLVVTSPYHVFRAGMILRDVLPDNDIRVVSNPKDYFVEKWWTDQYSAQQVVAETAKLAHYLLGGAFRSTDAH